MPLFFVTLDHYPDSKPACCGVWKNPDTKPTQPKFQRSAKKCSSLDSTERNYLMKLWTKLSSRKTPVEKKSLERQHETARQALLGKTPPDHTLLFQRGSVLAPTNGMHHFTALEIQRSLEICEEDFLKTLIRTHSEKSKRGSRSARPTLYQPYPWSKDLTCESSKSSVYSHPESDTNDSRKDQALKALHKSPLHCEKGSLQHRPHTSIVISRPGSNMKPILPPIPQGRKYSSA